MKMRMLIQFVIVVGCCFVTATSFGGGSARNEESIRPMQANAESAFLPLTAPVEQLTAFFSNAVGQQLQKPLAAVPVDTLKSFVSSAAGTPFHAVKSSAERPLHSVHSAAAVMPSALNLPPSLNLLSPAVGKMGNLASDPAGMKPTLGDFQRQAVKPGLSASPELFAAFAESFKPSGDQPPPEVRERKDAHRGKEREEELRKKFDFEVSRPGSASVRQRTEEERRFEVQNRLADHEKRVEELRNQSDLLGLDPTRREEEQEKRLDDLREGLVDRDLFPEGGKLDMRDIGLRLERLAKLDGTRRRDDVGDEGHRRLVELRGRDKVRRSPTRPLVGDGLRGGGDGLLSGRTRGFGSPRMLTKESRIVSRLDEEQKTLLRYVLELEQVKEELVGDRRHVLKGRGEGEGVNVFKGHEGDERDGPLSRRGRNLAESGVGVDAEVDVSDYTVDNILDNMPISREQFLGIVKEAASRASSPAAVDTHAAEAVGEHPAVGGEALGDQGERCYEEVDFKTAEGKVVKANVPCGFSRMYADGVSSAGDDPHRLFGGVLGSAGDDPHRLFGTALRDREEARRVFNSRKAEALGGTSEDALELLGQLGVSDAEVNELLSRGGGGGLDELLRSATDEEIHEVLSRNGLQSGTVDAATDIIRGGGLSSEDMLRLHQQKLLTGQPPPQETLEGLGHLGASGISSVGDCGENWYPDCELDLLLKQLSLRERMRLRSRLHDLGYDSRGQRYRDGVFDGERDLWDRDYGRHGEHDHFWDREGERNHLFDGERHHLFDGERHHLFDGERHHLLDGEREWWDRENHRYCERHGLFDGERDGLWDREHRERDWFFDGERDGLWDRKKPSCFAYQSRMDKRRAQRALRRSCPFGEVLCRGKCRKIRSPAIRCGADESAPLLLPKGCQALSDICDVGFNLEGRKCVSRFDPLLNCPQGTTLLRGKCAPNLLQGRLGHRLGGDGHHVGDPNVEEFVIPANPSYDNLAYPTTVAHDEPFCPDGYNFHVDQCLPQGRNSQHRSLLSRPVITTCPTGFVPINELAYSSAFEGLGSSGVGASDGRVCARIVEADLSCPEGFEMVERSSRPSGLLNAAIDRTALYGPAFDGPAFDYACERSIKRQVVERRCSAGYKMSDDGDACLAKKRLTAGRLCERGLLDGNRCVEVIPETPAISCPTGYILEQDLCLPGASRRHLFELTRFESENAVLPGMTCEEGSHLVDSMCVRVEVGNARRVCRGEVDPVTGECVKIHRKEPKPLCADEGGVLTEECERRVVDKVRHRCPDDTKDLCFKENSEDDEKPRRCPGLCLQLSPFARGRRLSDDEPHQDGGDLAFCPTGSELVVDDAGVEQCVMTTESVLPDGCDPSGSGCRPEASVALCPEGYRFEGVVCVAE